MSKHTPGPWTALCDPSTVRKNRMAMVATSHKEGMCIDVTTSGANYSEDMANARLIAAAPELLEALKAIEGEWRGELPDTFKTPPPERIGVLWEKARIAIAKAEGK